MNISQVILQLLMMQLNSYLIDLGLRNVNIFILNTIARQTISHADSD